MKSQRAKDAFLRSVIDTRLRGELPKIPDYKAAMRRPGPVGKSLQTNASHTSSVPSRQYTGTKMIGVATMHKSNSVPVFSNEEAINISKMRR